MALGGHCPFSPWPFLLLYPARRRQLSRQLFCTNSGNLVTTWRAKTDGMTITESARSTALTSFSPVKVIETDLSEPTSDIAEDARYGSAQVLPPWHGEPIAVVRVPLSAGRATPAQVAEALWPAVREPVAARYAAA